MSVSSGGDRRFITTLHNSHEIIIAVKNAQIIFFAWLTLGVFGLCVGQQVDATKTPPPRKFEHHGHIESSYDAETNKTQVVLNPYDVETVDTSGDMGTWQYFSIMCGFVYEGKTISGYPETIEFHIISDGTRGYRFTKTEARVLSIDIDKELIRLGTMSIVRSSHYAFGSSSVNAARSGYIEELSIILTYQGLLKIGEGKNVTLLLNGEKIHLKKKHLEALRDLASRIKV